MLGTCSAQVLSVGSAISCRVCGACSAQQNRMCLLLQELCLLQLRACTTLHWRECQLQLGGSWAAAVLTASGVWDNVVKYQGTA
jgi:hypothetical protein